MKAFPQKMIVINTGLLLLGLALTVVSVAQIPPIAQKISEALGIGCIVSVAISFLDHYLERKSPSQNPEVLTLNRSTIGPEVHNKKFTATEINMLGIALKECLDEISTSRRFADMIIEKTVTVQMAFVDPRADILTQRWKEDRVPLAALQERQRQCVADVVRLYKTLKTRYEKALDEKRVIRPMGSLDIWLIDVCPYITMARYDNEIYWGLYPSNQDGNRSPMFVTYDLNNTVPDGGAYVTDKTLFGRLIKHFESLVSNKYELLYRPAQSLLCVGLDGPKLTEDLAREVLGEDFDRMMREP